jgi:hypothetical protein
VASGSLLNTAVLLAGSQELSLLLEVSEMYCHISPSCGYMVVEERAWPILSAVRACSPQALASFATTCGDALISIAEYLVEDVLLVMGAAGGASATSRPTIAATPTSSHSNSKQQPRHGAGNPDVTLKHRRAWAQDVLSTLGLLCQPQPSMDSRLGQGGESSAESSASYGHQTAGCSRTSCFVVLWMERAVGCTAYILQVMNATHAYHGRYCSC